MAYTSNDLLKIIKKRAFLPVSQETFTDDDLLEMATDELYSQVVPAVLSTREEWYVTNTPVTVTASTTFLDIPSRAIGGSLRDVTFSQGDNTEWPLVRLDIEDKVYQNQTGPMSAFFVEGNQLQLLGSQDGVVNLYFSCRPGRLIATDAACRIQSVDFTTNQITVDAVPAAWTVGSVVDVVKAKPHFEYRNLSLTITDISGNVVTVGSTPATTIVANDWLTEEDTSPAPQIPVEWFSFLAEAVVMQIFHSQGDFDSAARAEKKMLQLRKSALDLMSPRIQGEPKRTVPPKNRGNGFVSRWRS